MSDVRRLQREKIRITNKMKSETPKAIQQDVFNKSGENKDTFFIDEHGDSIASGKTHFTAVLKFQKDLDIGAPGDGRFELTQEFMQKTGTIRMKTEKEGALSLEVNNISLPQLRRIRQYEKDGHEIIYDVVKNNKIVASGNGFKGFAKALRDFGL